MSVCCDCKRRAGRGAMRLMLMVMADGCVRRFRAKARRAATQPREVALVCGRFYNVVEPMSCCVCEPSSSRHSLLHVLYQTESTRRAHTHTQRHSTVGRRMSHVRANYIYIYKYNASLWWRGQMQSRCGKHSRAKQSHIWSLLFVMIEVMCVCAVSLFKHIIKYIAYRVYNKDRHTDISYTLHHTHWPISTSRELPLHPVHGITIGRVLVGLLLICTA